MINPHLPDSETHTILPARPNRHAEHRAPSTEHTETTPVGPARSLQTNPAYSSGKTAKTPVHSTCRWVHQVCGVIRVAWDPLHQRSHPPGRGAQWRERCLRPVLEIGSLVTREPHHDRCTAKAQQHGPGKRTAWETLQKPQLESLPQEPGSTEPSPGSRLPLPLRQRLGEGGRW